MASCELDEETECGGQAKYRVVWDLLGIEPERVWYVCSECRETYDAATRENLGPIDPRDIPDADRSRTLNRFIPKIDWERIDDIVEDCWPWKAGKFKNTGYGAFRFDGKTGCAHQYSFKQAYGIEPPSKASGLEIIHECGENGCVNPAHLWIGTGKQNQQLGVVLGEQAKKLNLEIAERIREEYVPGEIKQEELGEKYGVEQTNISQIIRGEIYNPDVCLTE